jgi:hypothetical protein
MWRGLSSPHLLCGLKSRATEEQNEQANDRDENDV